MQQQNRMKKMRILTACFMLAVGLTACGFHVGTSGKSEDYNEIFTDRAAELDKSYKASDLAYVFSVGDYGSMMVYVDTTDGHSFEVVKDSAEFIIKNSDGNTVIHAYFMDKEAYAVMTAESDEIRTVNGRDFVYSKDQSYYHMFSYMADCGLDLGMVLESDTDETVFRQVAFRGDALDGASSDVYTYKGTSTDNETDIDFEENTDDSADDRNNEASAAGSAGSMVNSTLSADAENRIKQLDTDYQKINWAVRYSAGDEAPYVVISVAPYVFYDQYYLLIGVTNLYDRDISFSGTASAKGGDDEVIGDTFLYAGVIGSGNTVFGEICCSDELPDGRIYWSDCEISYDVYKNYVPWEADYQLSGNYEDEALTIDYSIYGTGGKTTVPGCVTFLLLDESGNVMAKGEDYVDEEIAPGDAYEGQIKVYGDEEWLMYVKEVARFAESAN